MFLSKRGEWQAEVTFDRPSVGDHREEVGHRAVAVSAQPRPAELDAHELARDAPPRDLAQRVAADEVLLLLELDHPLVAVAHLVGVLLDRHVAAMREDPAL